MPETWLNFAALIFVQLLLFGAVVVYRRKLHSVTPLLSSGVFIGLGFGLFFDLVLGKFIGLHSYALGFGAFFLVLNALLSYGLFSATMLLFKEEKLAYFFGASFFVMLVYEVTNFYFRVWTWEFSLEPLQFLVVLSIGYFAGSHVVMFAEKIFFKQKH